ncbi:MAG: histidine phosphatase family protein [Planctomycetes bacterium]|nr:histidine phosphatase family protein [Planctomycetota bacterium]
MPPKAIYRARHGETEWALALKHTGRTDIALTTKGEHEARNLGKRLKGITFDRVLTSPLQRARKTAELAGFASVLEVEPDLQEWDYGHFEGMLSVEIHKTHPKWHVFHDGCPGGESVADITARIDGLLKRIAKMEGNVLLFAHGHVLRVLAARFLGFDLSLGQSLYLGTASVSILGYEHPPHDPVIRLWNDRLHHEG